MLETFGIRTLKLYATRHTFITEKVRAGGNLLLIAQYVGTSLSDDSAKLLWTDWASDEIGTVGWSEWRRFNLIAP